MITLGAPLVIFTASLQLLLLLRCRTRVFLSTPAAWRLSNGASRLARRQDFSEQFLQSRSATGQWPVAEGPGGGGAAELTPSGVRILF